MSRHIAVNMASCLGCHTCELACAVAHSESLDLEVMAARGERPGTRIHVESWGPRAIPLSCQHCEEAACALACPTGAVKRLAPGKPVLLDESRCVGCAMCVQACPFGVIAMKAGGKVAFKCDLCIRRQAQGLQPACASSCPTRAIYVTGDDEASSRSKRRLAVQRLAEAVDAGAEEARVLQR
jgi:carbon-monoxide dehydrogenase iron sulfur subunit